MKTFTMMALTVLCSIAGATTAARAADAPDQPVDKAFRVHPIGQVQIENDRTRIVLDKKYQPGLKGLEAFTHIHVIWWFDKNDTPEKRAILQVHPRGNRENPLTGVFATRSPMRPNLLALSLCKIVAISDNVIEVEKIDAFAGTPVLDIKPFTPAHDTAADAKGPGWAK
jgi:tRNA-Thr(GGU) m(6)t(6)A37 methyltransferase TsaA